MKRYCTLFALVLAGSVAACTGTPTTPEAAPTLAPSFSGTTPPPPPAEEEGEGEKRTGSLAVSGG